MKWYIGQPIVAIRSHSQGIFKKGDEFIIKGIRTPLCNCKNLDIDIGFRPTPKRSGCRVCNVTYPSDGIYWFSEVSFAPLDVDISELIEVLETTEPFTI